MTAIKFYKIVILTMALVLVSLHFAKVEITPDNKMKIVFDKDNLHSFSSPPPTERGINTFDEQEQEKEFKAKLSLFKKNAGSVKSDQYDTKLSADIKTFEKFLNKDYVWWINNFAKATKLQKNIRQRKREENSPLEKKEIMNLELSLVLAIINNMTIAEVSANQIEDFNLSSKQWALLIRFVNSGDLSKMIKNKNLNAEYLEFENLEIFYSSKRSIVLRDGVDITRATSSVEDDQNDRDSGID